MTKPAHYSAMELTQISMDNMYEECQSLLKKMDGKISPSFYRAKRAAVKRNYAAMQIVFTAFCRYINAKFTTMGKPIPIQLQEFHGKMKVRLIDINRKLEDSPRSI